MHTQMRKVQNMMHLKGSRVGEVSAYFHVFVDGILTWQKSMRLKNSRTIQLRKKFPKNEVSAGGVAECRQKKIVRMIQ